MKSNVKYKKSNQKNKKLQIETRDNTFFSLIYELKRNNDNIKNILSENISNKKQYAYVVL